MSKSFRQFIEDSDKSPLLSSMEDMLGIRPEDIKKEPLIGTFFKLGKGTNLGSYRVLEFKRNSEGKITHALVQTLSMDKTYKDDEEGYLNRVPNKNAEGATRLVAIGDLDKLMGQDFSSNQQQMA